MYKLKENDFVCILTGAGISAESGIQTFRDGDGLWENHRVEDVATPEGFIKNPILVWKFYKERYAAALDAEPNPGHKALVDLEAMIPDKFFLITQNVDGLHRRAGSQNLVEMHGRLSACFCIKCAKHFQLTEINLKPALPHCPACGNYLRPDIVWFGEMPYHMDQILATIKKCTVFITIGTSGNVYPAASFMAEARKIGAVTITVNLEEPLNNQETQHFIKGKAGEILPGLVKDMTAELG
ncbi:MAG: NAD-dependent deacylase [Candidatus Cloacimonetes bacterium]|nr:NAD-dependent deacylase [Candidatus Cloacimonadota bacterium]